MFQSVNPKDPALTAKWTAGSVRQRIHPVSVKDGGIYVKLSINDGTLDSDRYNKNKDDKDKNK